MRIRAFTTTLLAAVLLVGLPPSEVVAHGPTTDAVARVASTDDDDTTRPTVNEFFPEERPLSDCLSSLPKPNCGSEARGGWAQTAVFVSIVVGLAFIAWRVVAGARRARRRAGAPAEPLRPGTPDATTARDGDGGVPAP